MDELEKSATTIIRRRNQNGEVKESLQMTDEEFAQLLEQYSKKHSSFRMNIPFSEKLLTAQEKAASGEEIKLGNFKSVDTDVFEKAVCLIHDWSEAVLNALLRGKNFHIEITYNAEVLKTDMCIYTSTK